MATKVEAALIAAGAGVPVVVTSTVQVAAALAGERVGTLFLPVGPPSLGPAVLAALRQPPARPAGPRRRRGAGGPRARRLAAGRRHHRRHAATSSPTTRSSWSARTASSSPAAWSPTTPHELPALFGRKTGDLDPEYRREVVHRDEMVLVGHRAPKPVPTA